MPLWFSLISLPNAYGYQLSSDSARQRQRFEWSTEVSLPADLSTLEALVGAKGDRRAAAIPAVVEA